MHFISAQQLQALLHPKNFDTMEFYLSPIDNYFSLPFSSLYT